MTKKRDKRKPDSWMPMFFGDFHADTSNLSLELKMALLNILWWMWRNGAKAPNDDEQLAKITGLGARKWRGAKATLMLFFSVSDNWIFQKRLTAEYEHAWRVYLKRVESGKKGGRPAGDGAEVDLFDVTERGTERFPERGPQQQQQPQPPSPPIDDASGEIPEVPLSDSARADLRKICKHLGSAGVDCSTADPHLVAALREGFTAADVIGLAKTKKGAGKSPAYLLSTLRGQRDDASGKSASAPAPAPAGDPMLPVLEAELQGLENEIYDARHAFDIRKDITAQERDRRIQAARARIGEVVAAINAAGGA